MTKKLLSRNSTKLVWFLLVVLVFYLGIQGVLSLVSNKAGIRAHCSEIKVLIASNQDQWSEVFTTAFDAATVCDTEACRRETVQLMLNSLHDTHRARFFQSSYLVRLNDDGNLEKWFWSGTVVTTIPTTAGEKQVVKLLQGKTPSICTQNWKLDSGLTYMQYLRDGYSEAETIISVTQGREILGAVVSRFGD